MSICGSLPPLLDSAAEGELHFIILRPVLFPPLNPNQSLEFSFTWFGSSSSRKACLAPNEDEIKLHFTIHCDERGFRRYLRHANNLKVHVRVKGECTRIGSSPPSRLARNRHSSRSRREWKDGDNIGIFDMCNLKLNTKGWYVRECPIHDNFQESCGSIHVYMVYSDNCESPLPPDNKGEDSLSKPKLSPKIEPSTPGKKGTDVQPRLINKLPLTKSPKDKRKVKQSGLSNANPSKSFKQRPTFAPMQDVHPNSNNSNQNRSKHRGKLNDELKKRDFENRGTLHNTKSHEASIQISNENLFTHQKTNHMMNPNFLLTELFSLIDSRAISKLDLPFMMQLYQGLSPSCEYEVGASLSKNGHGFFQESLSSIKGFDKVPHPSNAKNEQLPSLVQNANETISGISPLNSSNFEFKNKDSVSPTQEEEAPSIIPSLTSKFCTLGREDSPPGSPLQKSASPPRELQQLPQQTPLIESSDSCSLLILEIDKLVLDIGNLGIPESKQSSHSSSSKVSIPVRQRSKVCYIVHFMFHFASKVLEEETVFVSRRVESGVVQFNSSTIVKLPPMDSMADGVLKIKVVRRTLGKKLGEEIAFSVILLKEILNYNLSAYIVKLWLPNAAGTSKRNLNSLKYPIGNLHFKAAFALSPHNELMRKRSNLEDSYEHNEKDWHSVRDRQITSDDQEGSYAQFIDSNLQKYDKDEDSSLHHGSCYYGDSEKDSKYLIKRLHTDHQLPISHTDRESKETQTQISQRDLSHIPKSEETSPKGAPIFIIDQQTDATRINVISSPRYESAAESIVHLEIIEAQGLPLVELGNGDDFEPCCYAKTSTKTFAIETGVITFSCNPLWNFEADVPLQFQDLSQTNGHVIIKLYHCVEGVDTHYQDPLIGFASIDTTSLQGGLVSLCGWFPLLNVNGRKSGRIKVSLTPHEPLDENSSCGVLHLESTKAEEDLRIRFEKETNDFAEDTQSAFYHKSKERLPRQPDNILKAEANQDRLHYKSTEEITPHCICCPSSRAENAQRDVDQTFIVEDQEEDSGVSDHDENENNNLCLTSQDYSIKMRNHDIPLERSLSNDSYIVDQRNIHQYEESIRRLSSSVNVLEEILPERHSSINTRTNKVSLNHQSINAMQMSAVSNPPCGLNPILDAFCWMNRMNCNLDSPSVSYMSMYSQTMSRVERNDAPPQAGTKVQSNFLTKHIKKRKTRIAAKLNFY